MCNGDDQSHDLSADEQRTVSVFENNSASVVHINTFIEQGRYNGGYRLDLHEIPRGSGSGFMWDDQHVVTNFHVIKDAHRATITFADHSSCEASLVGAEPDFDLAVLRVEGRDRSASALKPLELGHSRNLQVGQRVYAIGNPFGLDQTLTMGIVSGLGREMRGVSGRTMRGLVQTDAAINPGNSGGPLLDARGRLIGVNTMIASPSGAFAGVGLAIPSDTVSRIVRQLVQYGYTRKAFLGVVCAPDHVTKQLARQMPGGLEGVLTLSVEQGSPAEKAELRPTHQTPQGIHVGDEIVKLGGHKVKNAESLVDAVEACDIGQEVEIVYRRRERDSSKQFSDKVVLGERPQRPLMRNVDYNTQSAQAIEHHPRL